MACKKWFPVKCFPCLKFFEGGKLLMAIALLVVGVMMIVQEPNVINCNKFTATCPAALNGLIKSLAPNATSGIKLPQESFENEIVSYCDCISSCMNYFLVYEDNQNSSAKNNCYTKSIAAGVKGNANTALASTVLTIGTNPSGRSSGGMLVTTNGQCSSCEDIQGNEGKVFRALGGIAVLCALALTVSSTCEVLGVKMRNRCFSLCTISTDVSVMVLLAVASVIGGIWFGLSSVACDPDLLTDQLAKASDSSTFSLHIGTDGNKADAAFFNFLVGLLSPLASGLCAQRKKFAVFCLASSLAYTFTQFTVIATICICCKCSKDKKIKHIHHAKEVQRLMESSSDDE